MRFPALLAVLLPLPLQSATEQLQQAERAFALCTCGCLVFHLTLLLLAAGCTKIPTFVDPAKAWSLAPARFCARHKQPHYVNLQSLAQLRKGAPVGV
jgi:hypothetical protein